MACVLKQPDILLCVSCVSHVCPVCLGFQGYGFRSAHTGQIGSFSSIHTHSFAGAQKIKVQCCLRGQPAPQGRVRNVARTGSVHRAFATRLPQRGEPGVFKKRLGGSLEQRAARPSFEASHSLLDWSSGRTTEEWREEAGTRRSSRCEETRRLLRRRRCRRRRIRHHSRYSVVGAGRATTMPSGTALCGQTRL